MTKQNVNLKTAKRSELLADNFISLNTQEIDLRTT